MKRVFLLLLLQLTFVFGGYSGHQGAYIDMYDTALGLYYKGVSNKPKKSNFIISVSNYSITNIAVFDPKNNTSKMIFPSYNQNITDILFEMEYKDGKIVFNDIRYNRIKNNQNISKRSVKNRILIETYNRDKKETTLWSCTKDAKNLKKVATFSKDYTWHIDVKNEKIRVIYSKNNQFKIESFDW